MSLDFDFLLSRIDLTRLVPSQSCASVFSSCSLFEDDLLVSTLRQATFETFENDFTVSLPDLSSGVSTMNPCPSVNTSAQYQGDSSSAQSTSTRSDLNERVERSPTESSGFVSSFQKWVSGVSAV